MKNVKKISIILALALGFSGLNAQEADGVFFGFEAGGGEMKAVLPEPIPGGTLLTVSAPIYGGKIGYKHFLASWFGLRYYVNADYTANTMKSNTLGLKEEMHTKLLTYGANIDALFNLYNGDSSIGVFGGIGLGYQSWKFNYFDTFANLKADGFYADAKVGVRISAGNHEVEIFGKFPFTEAKKTILGDDVKYKSKWQVLVGYNFAF